RVAGDARPHLALVTRRVGPGKRLDKRRGIVNNSSHTAGRRAHMRTMTRRQFLRTSAGGLGVGALAAGCAAPMTRDIAPKSGRRVVVIGGGWGGASAAKYLRLSDPSIEVVLLEPNDRFISCPFSNLVLSGVRTMESITRDYRGLGRHGVKLMAREATA